MHRSGNCGDAFVQRDCHLEWALKRISSFPFTLDRRPTRNMFMWKKSLIYCDTTKWWRISWFVTTIDNEKHECMAGEFLKLSQQSFCITISRATISLSLKLLTVIMVKCERNFVPSLKMVSGVTQMHLLGISTFVSWQSPKALTEILVSKVMKPGSVPFRPRSVAWVTSVWRA